MHQKKSEQVEQCYKCTYDGSFMLYGIICLIISERYMSIITKSCAGIVNFSVWLGKHFCIFRFYTRYTRNIA